MLFENRICVFKRQAALDGASQIWLPGLYWILDGCYVLSVVLTIYSTTTRLEGNPSLDRWKIFRIRTSSLLEYLHEFEMHSALDCTPQCCRWRISNGKTYASAAARRDGSWRLAYAWRVKETRLSDGVWIVTKSFCTIRGIKSEKHWGRIILSWDLTGFYSWRLVGRNIQDVRKIIPQNHGIQRDSSKNLTYNEALTMLVSQWVKRDR